MNQSKPSNENSYTKRSSEQRKMRELKCNNSTSAERRSTVKPLPKPYRQLNSMHVCTKNKTHNEQTRAHNKKLKSLSVEQEQPLFSVDNTVVTYELDHPPPEFVMKTLALGPKNAVLDKFDPKDILAELDGLLNHCKKNKISNDTITDINVKTLTYIKKCKRMKSSRNVDMTKKYLKENNLLAIPFDKGIGICIMKKEMYESKLDAIINLPQFEEVVSTRKNAKHPMVKEEERVVTTLQRLRDNESISEELYGKLKPLGSQPARLYGLAKVHKNATPVRPVLSMPGSSYYNIATCVAGWLSAVDECGINSSTKQISDCLGHIQLEEEEELVSFDVSSLYTNVPVIESINVCAELLFSGKYKLPPVDKQTFIELAKMASCDVIMSTHRGYFKQVDGQSTRSAPRQRMVESI